MDKDGFWRMEIEALWIKRHLDGANFAFADGHVKWLKSYTDGTNIYRSTAVYNSCTGTQQGKPTFGLQYDDLSE